MYKILYLSILLLIGSLAIIVEPIDGALIALFSAFVTTGFLPLIVKFREREIIRKYEWVYIVVVVVFLFGVANIVSFSTFLANDMYSEHLRLSNEIKENKKTMQVKSYFSGLSDEEKRVVEEIGKSNELRKIFNEDKN